jgi:hypothetical protein
LYQNHFQLQSKKINEDKNATPMPETQEGYCRLIVGEIAPLVNQAGHDLPTFFTRCKSRRQTQTS